LINGNIDIEKTSFRTFLVFSFFVLILLIPSYLIFSSKYMVRNIEFLPKYDVDSSFLETLYGKSIWTLDETSLESLYSADPTIEKIELTKILPSKLEIKLKLYEQVAEISDLRGSQPKLFVLYKNLYTSESIDASKNTVSVTIVNGPVDNGFNGEIVALFMTLNNFDEINTGSLKLTHLGTSVVGYYKDTEILFGSPIDLATKAAAVGELLSDGSCKGTVRFVSTNSFVTNCNI
tara:strand:+ start:560 stop:1261 length:702 start_codon:yes stop_codon:yes gene_type:complete